jgi:hypothetical protein
MNSPWINIALLITIIYFSYELLEYLVDLDFSSLIGDLLEFLLGLLFGYTIIVGPAPLWSWAVPISFTI